MALEACPICNASLPQHSHFCPTCGRALGDVERPRTTRNTGGWVEFVDRCWDFFASTKVAWVLIGLVGVASIAGSLIEQEGLYQDWRPPEMYYPDRYGEFWGPLFMKLGLTHAYSSVWYVTLILLCVINLIIGSLHRLVPLQRMLTNPQVWKLPHFIRRLEVVYEFGGCLEAMERKLKSMGYKTVRDRECVYGDRGRLSRYGPYVIHVGLLVIAFAAFAKAIPGWDISRDVWIPDGDIAKVTDTNFAIQNHRFTMELYPTGMPKRYATDASILVDGQEVKRQTIEVNAPLAYDGWEIYQASWRQELGDASVSVWDAATRVKVGDFTVDPRRPEAEYRLNNHLTLVVDSFYTDFTIDPETYLPTNASFELKNPVLMGRFVEGEREVGQVGLMIAAKGRSPIFEGKYYLEADKVETRWYTALKLHKDRTTPYMFAGLGIVLAGMAMSFFLFHDQVWVREEDGKILLGARANKNKYRLKREFQRLFGAPQGEGTNV